MMQLETGQSKWTNIADVLSQLYMNPAALDHQQKHRQLVQLNPSSHTDKLDLQTQTIAQASTSSIEAHSQLETN